MINVKKEKNVGYERLHRLRKISAYVSWSAGCWMIGGPRDRTPSKGRRMGSIRRESRRCSGAGCSKGMRRPVEQKTLGGRGGQQSNSKVDGERQGAYRKLYVWRHDEGRWWWWWEMESEKGH